jgi:hypothetical protein
MSFHKSVVLVPTSEHQSVNCSLSRIHTHIRDRYTTIGKNAGTASFHKNCEVFLVKTDSALNVVGLSLVLRSDKPRKESAAGLGSLENDLGQKAHDNQTTSSRSQHGKERKILEKINKKIKISENSVFRIWLL